MEINSYLKKFMNDFYTNPGYKKYHLSHNDLDGYACQVTSRMSRVFNVHIRYENAMFPNILVSGTKTVDFINKLAGYSKSPLMLLITDLGLDENIVDALNQSGIYYAVVDHHILSASVREKLGERLYHEEDGHCAAYLLRQLICETLPEEVSYRCFDFQFEHYIDSVDKYDIGKFGYWSENHLSGCSDPIKEQLLFLGYGPIQYVDCVERDLKRGDNHLRSDIILPQFNLLAFQYDMVKTYIYHSIQFDTETNTDQTIAVCPFCVPMYSIIANRYLKENAYLNVVAIAFIDMKRMHVSMRSLDGSFDCQAFCKKFRGGGHKNAAGFSFENIEYGNALLVHYGDDESGILCGLQL